jgi:glycosyltransferase involved in cell wall biosynthesis
MARIALVEAYPYATIRGGDGVYLDRLRSYLIASGHEVLSIITDLSRGRTNPFVRLHTEATGDHRWRLRAAIRIGRDLYLSWAPGLLWNAARRLIGKRPADGEPGMAEGNWLQRQILDAQPDVVILAFGACAFSGLIAAAGTPVAAIRGFLAEVENRIDGGGRQVSAVLARKYAELAPADFVAFNNRADIASYTQRTGKQAFLVGIGFPQRPVAAANAEPVLLFVGAATSCNLQSLHWFLDRCWPSILDRVPGVELRVVGSIGAAIGADVPPGVTIVGVVADLEPEYRSAQLVVAPLISGSNGVKTKVAEALSFGRSLVTTSLGLDPEDHELAKDGLIVADDETDFANAVITLLVGQDVRKELELKAAVLFQYLYSEASAYNKLDWFIGESQGRFHRVHHNRGVA